MTVAPCRPTTLSHAVADEREHRCISGGRLVVGDHEARDVAGWTTVAPATVALVLVERLAAHDDRAEAIEHLPQDDPVVVGRRVGQEPGVQHPGAIAKRVLPAVIRAGDVPVQRHGHVADHSRHW
jgi:hypothetical protein